MDRKPAEPKPFVGRNTYYAEYGKALRKNYPEVVSGWLEGEQGDEPPAIRGNRPSQRQVAAFTPDVDEPTFEGRFQDPLEREWRWEYPRYNRAPKWSIPGYKGLLRMKIPTDLMLYTHLIWELQPRSIIEFGALQGGSGLWFADQLDALQPEGKVYSFEYLVQCIHPLARKHPRLSVLSVDLNDLDTINTGVLQTAPHPWLIVEDAHVNVFGLFAFLDQYMQSGDYYILEDQFRLYMSKQPDAAFMAQYGKIAEMGYTIDTHYCDAFGYNATAFPNAWFRKS
jgi:cephalosporin hydroxylase